MIAHMRSTPDGLILFVSTVVLIVFASLDGCSPDKPGVDTIRRDDLAIRQMLDSAVLSEAPAQAFARALPMVRAHASVDSAWTDGPSIFVRYKNGGIVTWTVPPAPLIQDAH
jgi:hypothetical protein